MTFFIFDMGLPMIIPSMYLMVLALLPIIFAEACVIAASLRLNLLNVLRRVAIANLVSTFVGIPVTWFLLTVLQLITGSGNFFSIETFWGKLIAVTWQAPWALPYGPKYDWIIYVSMIVLLIPYFFASWYVENLVVRGKISTILYNKSILIGGENDPVSKKLEIEALFPQVSRAVRKANLVSYGILALLVFGMLLFGLSRAN